MKLSCEELIAEAASRIRERDATIAALRQCPKCEGKGIVEVFWVAGSPDSICPNCHGSGRRWTRSTLMQ